MNFNDSVGKVYHGTVGLWRRQGTINAERIEDIAELRRQNARLLAMVEQLAENQAQAIAQMEKELPE